MRPERTNPPTRGRSEIPGSSRCPLTLDNSITRSKVLIGAVATATKLLEAEREESWRWEGDG